MKQLRKGSSDERRLRIIEISRTKDSKYLPQLLERLQTESSINTRRHIVRAIGNIGNKLAVPALKDIIENETGDIVGDATHAIGMLKAIDMIPTLEILSNNQSQWISQQAKWALKTLKQNTQPAAPPYGAPRADGER